MSDHVFIVADPRRSPTGEWVADVVRKEDERVMFTLSLNSETMPPRKKNGKVVWKLPGDASQQPRLGIQERERVIGMFREDRKRKKNAKKRTGEGPQKPDTGRAGASITRSLRAYLWRLRLQAWRRAAGGMVRRYSKDFLLSLRSSGQPPGEHDLAHITRAFVAAGGVVGDASQSPKRPVRGVAAAFSKLDRPQPPRFGGPPGLLRTPGNTDHEASQPHSSNCNAQQPPSPGFSSSPRPMDKDTFKRQWKSNIMARLDALAERAWESYAASQMQRANESGNGNRSGVGGAGAGAGAGAGTGAGVVGPQPHLQPESTPPPTTAVAPAPPGAVQVQGQVDPIDAAMGMASNNFAELRVDSFEGGNQQAPGNINLDWFL